MRCLPTGTARINSWRPAITLGLSLYQAVRSTTNLRHLILWSRNLSQCALPQRFEIDHAFPGNFHKLAGHLAA